MNGTQAMEEYFRLVGREREPNQISGASDKHDGYIEIRRAGEKVYQLRFDGEPDGRWFISAEQLDRDPTGAFLGIRGEFGYRMPTEIREYTIQTDIIMVRSVCSDMHLYKPNTPPKDRTWTGPIQGSKDENPSELSMAQLRMAQLLSQSSKSPPLRGGGEQLFCVKFDPTVFKRTGTVHLKDYMFKDTW